MREICKSGSEGGAGHTNAPSLPLSRGAFCFANPAPESKVRTVFNPRRDAP
jgi:hypothetical protein